MSARQATFRDDHPPRPLMEGLVRQIGTSRKRDHRAVQPSRSATRGCRFQIDGRRLVGRIHRLVRSGRSSASTRTSPPCGTKSVSEPEGDGRHLARLGNPQKDHGLGTQDRGAIGPLPPRYPDHARSVAECEGSPGDIDVQCQSGWPCRSCTSTGMSGRPRLASHSLGRASFGSPRRRGGLGMWESPDHPDGGQWPSERRTERGGSRYMPA